MRQVFGEDVPREVIGLIAGAEKTLVLVSAYFDPWNHCTQAIAMALQRGVTVTLILRGGEELAKHAAVAAPLKALGVSVLYVDRLHAKFYLSEKAGIVTSLNLVKASATDSWEIGVVIDRATEAKDYAELAAGVQKVGELVKVQSAMRQNAASPAVTARPASKPAAAGGMARGPRPSATPSSAPSPSRCHCIRCGASVAATPEKPMCRDCYAGWVRDGSPANAETFCFKCGRRRSTFMRQPTCRECRAAG